MPLRAQLFQLPLPVPALHTIPALPAPPTPPDLLRDASVTLADDRTTLAKLSAYRTAIIANDLVPNGRTPLTMAQTNAAIATQRAVVKQQQDYLAALRANV